MRKSPVSKNEGFASASSYDWSKDAKDTEDSFFGSFNSKSKKTRDSQVIFYDHFALKWFYEEKSAF